MARLTAITRLPSRSLGDCELTHLERLPIDIDRALEQHAAYRAMLEACGARVETLPPLDDSPDGTFVEDVALVLDEVAVLCSMGAESRRAEVPAIASALSPFRPLRSVELPGRIDGGDVQRVGRVILVGLSGRTDAAGIDALREIVTPFGYTVRGIVVDGCLHFKSACTVLPDGRLLINPAWVDRGEFAGFDTVDIDPSEPWAADVLTLGRIVVMGAPHPGTRAILEAEDLEVRVVDLSEFAKAEAGVTCLSLVFETE